MKKITILITLIIVFATCKKSETSVPAAPVLATITSTLAADITLTTAKITFNVTSDGGSPIISLGICYGTKPDLTATKCVLLNDKDIGVFTTTLTGLSLGTTYYVRAYATNSAGYAYGNWINFTTQGESITYDYDGNIYHNVTIGTQIWMIENLKTTKYRDSTPISNVADSIAWSTLTTGAYVNYNNDATNGDTYGRLYNGHAINNPRNIAPVGWHVPTDAEWATLITYLGGDTIAADKLIEAGNKHWLYFNKTGTNSSGFTGLPGGFRGYNDPSAIGKFFDIGSQSVWWSSTVINTYSNWGRSLVSAVNGNAINRFGLNWGLGLSVRCIKD
jgi:uncharacterized protein (TIGR02145 family)